MNTFSSVTLVFLCLVSLAGTASANVLSAGSATVSAIGSSASVNVTFDEFPNGLSGYSINVSVDDPYVATITALSYPSWATLSETPVLPSAECLVKGADLSEKVQSGATDVRLVTVTLQGLVGGSTAINLTINKMNDDNDVRLKPTIVSGTFTVDAPPTTPVAAFTANVTSGYAPLTVAFTDQSANAPTSWAWDFDNNGVTDSTTRRPVFTYTTPGTYTVRLSVTNPAGSDSEVKTGYIVVIEPLPEPPVANFAKNVSSGKAPLAVQFTDTSTGGAATSWVWDFQNDGITDSTEQNPVFVYTKAGSYSVNLTAANAGGTDSRLKADSITVSLPDPPVAAYSATPTSGPAPLTVQFTDESTGSPDYWFWSFRDGDTSTEQNPSHTYTLAGTYTVKLTATNDGGSDSEEKTGYITVTDSAGMPVAAFSAAPTSGAAPLTVQFTDQSTASPTSWSWTFGDGATSTEQNPSHTYSTAGTYTVNLTATNADGFDSEEKTGFITVTSAPIPPVASFTAVPTMGTAPLAVQFTDQSTGTPTSWSWTFGDGATSTEQNPSHTYSTAGTYTVNLTATNTDGSDNEEKSGYITVTSAPIPPVASFTAVPTMGTAPLAVQFTDQSTGSPTSWSWTFGDGATSTEQNPSHTYSTAGTYTVNLTATNTDGSDSEEKIGYITISGASVPPVASFTAVPTMGTAPLAVQFTDQSTGTPTSWSWTFGDGATSTEQNPSHTYSTVGTYTVNLTATNADGSDNEEKIGYITISGASVPPVASFTAVPTSGVAPLPVQFTDQSTGSPTSWYWTFGDGATSTEQNPSHTYSTAGTYTVNLTATNADGSDSEEKSGYITVTSAPIPPVASFTATPTTGINPLTVQFTDRSANMPTAWSWSFGDGGTSTEQDPSHSYLTAGTYTVNLTATNAAGSGSEEKNGYIKVLDSSQTTVILTPQSRTIPLGSTDEYVVSVTSLPSGIAGYRLGISLSNASTGEIMSFTLPAWATLNTSSSVPGDSIWFGGLDLGRTIEGSVTNVALGTVKVRGDAVGNSTLVVQVYEMDADGGGQITPSTVNGQLVVTAAVIPFPEYTRTPTDPDSDGRYEDINGNGRLDFDDVVTLYQQMQWVRDTVSVGTDPYDFNGNGRLDFDDIVLLYYEVLAK